MKILTLFTILWLPTSLVAQDFSSFQKILLRHQVEFSYPDGSLDTAFKYEQAKLDPKTESDLEEQDRVLTQFDPKTLTSKNESMSFWINAYNYFMIKVVLKEGFEGNIRKINSVKDLGSFFSPYKIFKNEQHNIGGKKYSLDQIEKGILLGEDYRKKGWKDARIHFAVNCASAGCPPLLKSVYQPDKLDKVLDQNIEQALRNKRHLKFKGETLYLTHLFKWYKDDFKESAGSVKNFLIKYIKDPKIKARVEQAKELNYIEYDWKLNRPQNIKQ